MIRITHHTILPSCTMTVTNDESPSISSTTEPSLEEAVNSLSRLLSERQKDLERQENELAERRAVLDRERREFGVGNYSSSDVIPLNISGHITATLRRTLTMLEGSMLASRFSGRWDDSLEKDREGNFFVDQPFELFGPLLDHLRAKQSFTPSSHKVASPTREEFKSQKMFNDFKRMVEYYGMTPAVFPTVVLAHSGTDSVAIVSDFPPVVKINAKESGMFELKTDGHGRAIKSFEVTIGQVELFQIGWLGYSGHCKLTCHKSEGVGAHALSHVLDVSRGGMVCPAKDSRGHEVSDSTDFTKVDGVRIGQGSVIQCIVSTEADKSCIIVDGTSINLTGKVSSSDIAAFSGRGTWTVTKVDLAL